MRAVIALLALVIGAVLAAPAGANTTTPYPQSSCTITAFGGTYEGTGNAVFQEGSLLLVTCRAQLVSGTPVIQTTRTSSGNCNQVVTPAGEATLTCTKQ
jgi:hypothetical protein